MDQSAGRDGTDCRDNWSMKKKAALTHSGQKNMGLPIRNMEL